MIYALEKATPEERQAIETVINDGNYEQVPFMRVLQVLEQHHAVPRAYERAHAFTAKARTLIATFPESPAQRALQAVVELVIERAS
jgi:octaprenyl-diphosphate synthase